MAKTRDKASAVCAGCGSLQADVVAFVQILRMFMQELKDMEEKYK